MNKFVFKKVAELTTERTELAEVKVDLALMEDIDKLNTDLSKLFQAVNQFYGFKAQATNYALSQSKEITNVLTKADNLVNIAIKQAKDLGIDLDSNATITKYKKAKDAMNATLKIYQNFIDKNK